MTNYGGVPVCVHYALCFHQVLHHSGRGRGILVLFRSLVMFLLGKKDTIVCFHLMTNYYECDRGVCINYALCIHLSITFFSGGY